MGGGSTRRLLSRPPARRLVRACVALSVLTTGVVLLQWVLVARFVTAVFTGQSTPAAAGGLLVGAAAAWCARAGLTAVRERLAQRASAALRRELRHAVAAKVLRVGPDLMAREEAGELVTTATEGVTKLDAVLARWVPGVVAAAVVPVLVAAAVLALDPTTAAILLLTGPLIVVFMWLIGTRTAELSRRQWASLGQLGALLVDTVRVLPTLVVYGRARAATGWLVRTSEEYRVATMRVLRTAFLSGFVLEFGATLCTALVAVTVGVRLFEGDLPLERALLVLLLTPEFFAPLRTLGADRHAMLEGRPAADRLVALLDLPEPPRGTGTVPAGVPHVRLRGVTVRHDGRTVLDGVDLDLPPGSRTALVGPSGAGKTTAVRVLLGFTAPDAGEVLVGGAPLTSLDPEAWRARVAYVPERPWLGPGSVADNVRLGHPGATDAEVEDALRRAHALPFVAALPRGVQTLLGENGAALSGGERLRIALARAFVKDADVVVLDEPTSQLDEASEAEVLAALAELAVDRTVVTVTHRSAPLAVHDAVVDVRDGRAMLRAGVPQGSR